MEWDQLDRPALYFWSFGNQVCIYEDWPFSLYIVAASKFDEGLVIFKPSLSFSRAIGQPMFWVLSTCEVKSCVKYVMWERRHSISASTCNFLYKKQLRSKIWPEAFFQIIFTSVVSWHYLHSVSLLSGTDQSNQNKLSDDSATTKIEFVHLIWKLNLFHFLSFSDCSQLV